MKDFAAIDFETANNERTSVCSIGIVIYRYGKKVDELYSLIKLEVLESMSLRTNKMKVYNYENQNMG